MKSLPIPDTITVYQLVRMHGLAFSAAPSVGVPSLGCGFYTTRQEAEHNRTLEILKEQANSSSTKTTWHIFELEFPNPALNNG